MKRFTGYQTFQKKKNLYEQTTPNSTQNYSSVPQTPTYSSAPEPISYVNSTDYQPNMSTPRGAGRQVGNTVYLNPELSQPQQQDTSKNFLDQYDARNRALAEGRAQTLQERSLKNRQLINETYDNANNRLDRQMVDLQSAAGEAQKRIETLRKLQEQKIQDRTGERIKAEGQAQREVRNNLENRFANLGTVDSGGSMGYQGQFAKAEDRYLSTLTGVRQQKDDLLRELDVNTQTKIDEEVGKFTNLITKIQNAKYQNEDQRKYDLLEVYNNLEDSLYSIESEYNKSVNDLDKVVYENAVKTQTGSSGGEQIKSNLLNVINKLENGDVGGITGLLQISSKIPGTSSSLASNYYEQLKGLLSLDNIKYLKGTGQISDAEQRMLASAASALGRNLSEDQFRQVLSELKMGLSGSSTNSTDDTRAKLRAAGFSEAEINEYLGGQ